MRRRIATSKLAGIAVSNPAEGMSVLLLCFLCKKRPLRRDALLVQRSATGYCEIAYDQETSKVRRSGSDLG